MLKMPEDSVRIKAIAMPEENQKAVNLTWVVIILTLVALLEGLQRGGFMISV